MYIYICIYTYINICIICNIICNIIYVYIYIYICMYNRCIYIIVCYLNFVKLSTLLIKNGSHNTSDMQRSQLKQ